ncbi:MAG TPA: hypothetical protein VEB00_14775 [Clostridia bacterium]|nr:hypothetical protein [Clostridia bacterium]
MPTREHIIPDGFLRGMNKSEQIRWTEAAPCKVINSDFIIKDVCSVCNNGVLSQLDTYAINEIIKYNGKIQKDIMQVIFEYDYNKLARWLLKICYNSARANKLEYDSNSYKNCIPYIKDNKEINNKISVYGLFIDLAINGKTHDYYHFDGNSEYTIDFFRIAPFKLKDKSTHKCSMRTIIINSFAFLIIVYDEDIDKGEINEIEKAILNVSSNFVKLEAYKKVELKKDNNFWQNSLYTNALLNENFLTKREVKNNDYKFYIIEISKEEILSRNYIQIQEYIVSKRDNKQNVKDNYQKFIISVSGYDDDMRELFCIAEFQTYIKEIITEFPEIIWYLNLEIGFFEAMFLAYINDNATLEVDNRIIMNKGKMMDFITKCYASINNLINEFAIDNSCNDKITNLLNEAIFKILKLYQ